MDPSSSNSEYQDHHRLGLQQREWLSCSTSAGTSTQIELRDVTIDDDDNDNNNSNDKDTRRLIVEREHMFDKVVTPSDVGKLNRLVIPKQHAEKYFPLDSTNTNNNPSGNTDNNNNNNKAGLLLNFEDRTGKSWRFRYSYWNSSQSYVMTKGWSRFVKEKQLSAGDIVSFQRAVGDDIHSKNTFFIDWRRRPPDHHHHHHHHLGTAFSVHHSIPTWGGGLGTSSTTPTFFLRSHPHESHPHHNHNALWDHSNFCNNNNNNNSNNVTHLSPMNGNIMNMVPYAYGAGSGSGSGSGPVNPSGSLILLRSPVPNSASLIPHLMPASSSSSHHHHHLMHPSLTTSSNDAFRRGGFENGLPKVYDSIPVVHGNAPVPSSVGGGPPKRSLRLFGVNMEYDNHELDGSTSTSSSNYDASQN
ncbi:uncharacterized protein LOC141653778 [Silene latifolia]|uniref:uncharacterized protein LOC141653778 n=1 Tax=Silene latifolia TaxID=37657 RepID=UPI003D775580